MELMISEETLRQMPAEDRAALARSLAAVNADLPSLSAAEHRRRRLVLMLTVASAVLIPWIVLLALTLPRHYVAGHWRLTWVGFDIILLAALAATAWFAWRRRQAVVITAFVTATLLTCDAWFDVTTASGQKRHPGSDRLGRAHRTAPGRAAVLGGLPPAAGGGAPGLRPGRPPGRAGPPGHAAADRRAQAGRLISWSAARPRSRWR